MTFCLYCKKSIPDAMDGNPIWNNSKMCRSCYRITWHCIQSVVKVIFVLQVAGDVGKIENVRKVLVAENEVFKGFLPGTGLQDYLFYNK